MKAYTDDYEGDHYVPRRGLAEARQFETDRQWLHLFDTVATDLKMIFEATEAWLRLVIIC